MKHINHRNTAFFGLKAGVCLLLFFFAWLCVAQCGESAGAKDEQAEPGKILEGDGPIFVERKSGESPTESHPNPKEPVWLPTLAIAQHQAAVEGKPLLVLLTAKWDPTCRKLAEVLEKTQVAAELSRWILAAIDVDQSPNDAARLNAVVVPALRIRTPGGQIASARDGLVSADELSAWLKKFHEIALAAPDEVLLAKGKPAAADVPQIVRQFEDSSEAVRLSAFRQLLPYPEIAALGVSRAFYEGNLTIKLATFELLREWRAPIDDFDLWTPETFTSEKRMRLELWAEKSADILAEPSLRFSPEKLDDAELLVERMLKASDQEADAVARQLAQYGPALLPRVCERLKSTPDEPARQRLTLLRYRLASNDSLMLRWPDGLSRLASSDPLQRRQAAEELADRATVEDHRLLLELFGDADLLVRQQCLRGLQTIGGADAAAAIVELLADPEPKVRAAALDQLASAPRMAMTPKVQEYLKTEKDPDLIVHVVRFLRAAGGMQATKSLVALMKHESRQVRCEAVAAINDSIAHSSAPSEIGAGNPEEIATKTDAYMAAIALLDDPDEDVVGRAVEALASADMEQSAIEPLIQAAEKHPNLAKDLVVMIAGNDKIKVRALPSLRKLCKNADATIRAAAAAGVAAASPDDASEEVVAALSDADSRVRAAAATGIYTLLDRTRRAARQTIGERDKEEGAWDRWLKAFRDGKDRPAGTQKTVPLLEKMLSAESPEERAAAATALAALGKTDRAVGALLEAASAEAKYLTSAAELLPWLVWDERIDAFRKLRVLANGETDIKRLMDNMLEVRDNRAIEAFWEILSDEKISPLMASGIAAGLADLYRGDANIDGSALDKTPYAKRLLAAAEPRVASGGELQRLAALVVLANLLPDEAAKHAAKMADDSRLSEQLRDDAFQIALAISPDKKTRNQTAVAALSSGDKQRKNIALGALVENARQLKTVRENFSLPIRADNAPISTRSDGEPIVPKPPADVDAKTIEPLLADEDRRTAAYAGYLLAVLGEPDGMDALLAYWRAQPKDDTAERLVYRAAAALDDEKYMSELREIYGRLAGDGRVSEFYWTIRVMSGSEAIKFRQEIRDKVGVERLQ
jgi:HEAT repeat protein